MRIFIILITMRNAMSVNANFKLIISYNEIFLLQSNNFKLHHSINFYVDEFTQTRIISALIQYVIKIIFI